MLPRAISFNHDEHSTHAHALVSACQAQHACSCCLWTKYHLQCCLGMQASTGSQEQLDAALQHTQQLEQQLADQHQQAAETLHAAEEVRYCCLAWTLRVAVNGIQWLSCTDVSAPKHQMLPCIPLLCAWLLCSTPVLVCCSIIAQRLIGTKNVAELELNML